MANTDTKFNSKSPNGVLGNNNQAPQFYEKYTFIDKGIEAQTKLNDRYEQQKRLLNDIKELESRKNDLKDNGNQIS